MFHNIYLEFPTTTLETQCLLVHNSNPNGLTTCFIDAPPNEENTLTKLLAHFYRLLADSLENKNPLPKESLGTIYLGHNNKYNWQFLNCHPASLHFEEGIVINWQYSEIKLLP